MHGKCKDDRESRGAAPRILSLVAVVLSLGKHPPNTHWIGELGGLQPRSSSLYRLSHTGYTSKINVLWFLCVRSAPMSLFCNAREVGSHIIENGNMLGIDTTNT
jgi:hypothetical protein